MSDPFGQFMDLWAPSVGVSDAFLSWQIKDAEQVAPFIAPDFEPFRDTSGKHISGRRSWREHLASTGTQELGHADLKRMTERHTALKQAHRVRMDRATREAPPMAADFTTAPVEPSRTAARVAERLHGRPAPDRRTLIKISMEERMRRG